MAMHILVAEDDANIRDGLKDTLELESYEVTTAVDGKDAVAKFAAGDFDLILLDIMMPQVNGYDVCKQIRQTNQRTPIIFLTAKGEEIDKVLGLELGADDYVTKPFGVRELLARIAAVLRRSRPSAAEEDVGDEFMFGPVKVNRRSYRGEVDGDVFDISRREMELIRIFYQHPGEALSRDELLRMAWEVEYGSYTRTLDQHISQLRKKVEPDAKTPSVITTVHGIGYRYEGDGA